jgi:hypothetical protein
MGSPINGKQRMNKMKGYDVGGDNAGPFSGQNFKTALN